MSRSQKQFLAECAKHGGKWYVLHSDNNLFANRVSDFMEIREDAIASLESLAPKYPVKYLRVAQQQTLKETRAFQREQKKYREQCESHYVVVKDMMHVIGGELRKVSSVQLSRDIKSKFDAVRMLRKLRRTNPAAYLIICTNYSDRGPHAID